MSDVGGGDCRGGGVGGCVGEECSVSVRVSDGYLLTALTPPDILQFLSFV